MGFQNPQDPLSYGPDFGVLKIQIFNFWYRVRSSAVRNRKNIIAYILNGCKDIAVEKFF